MLVSNMTAATKFAKDIYKITQKWKHNIHGLDITETIINTGRPMTLLGKQIKLSGISQKGKNRVRELGDRWMVWAETDRILFSPTQFGPWLFVSVVGRTQDDKSSRWVRVSGDNDFDVTVLDD
jgi:hypothetical protein